jgi:hypothetical protein
VTFSATMSALALAAASAGFSITGITSIFAVSFWPVMGMGVALELRKLSTMAWLMRYRATATWRLRMALVVLVGVLMTLNEGDVAAARQAADIDALISAQTGVVADRCIEQIDHAIEVSTAKGRTNGARALADQ